MSDSEAFFRAFHTTQPDVTLRAFARGGSYQRLATRVPSGRVLDLGGKGITPGSISIDIAPGASVQGRAQQLPFKDGSFDAATCHLAFMLFDDIEQVVAELRRVLVPGAPFLAVLGGGPTGDGDDAFHAFARMLPRSRGFGDRRASSEAGWQELFAGWRDLVFERWPIDLGGSFDEVWTFLGSSYQLTDAPRVREALRAQFPGEHVPCTVACYFASVTR